MMVRQLHLKDLCEVLIKIADDIADNLIFLMSCLVLKLFAEIGQC